MLTDIEFGVWMIAFASSQPQPAKKPNAVYWACAAVWTLRGEPECPTSEQAAELFQWVKERNRMGPRAPGLS